MQFCRSEVINAMRGIFFLLNNGPVISITIHGEFRSFASIEIKLFVRYRFDMSGDQKNAAEGAIGVFLFLVLLLCSLYVLPNVSLYTLFYYCNFDNSCVIIFSTKYFRICTMKLKYISRLINIIINLKKTVGR